MPHAHLHEARVEDDSETQRSLDENYGFSTGDVVSGLCVIALLIVYLLAHVFDPELLSKLPHH